MSNDISSRISWLLKKKNLSASKLAETLGIQKSSLSHIISGRNKPSFDFLLKLKQAFPEIDLDWLVTGKGEAFLIDDNNLNIPTPVSNSSPQTPTLFDMETGSKSHKQQTKKPVYKSKQDDLSSIVLIFDDDTYKILTPRE